MVKTVWKFCLRLMAQFLQGDCLLQSASLSFVTLLSLVPLMTVVLTVLAAFPAFKGIGDEIQQFVFANFVAESAQVVQHHIQTFIQQASRLSVTGMLFLIITAVLMIFAMEQAFNKIWRVPRRRKPLQAFLIYWAVLTLAPILVGAGFVVGHHLLYFAAFKRLSLTFFPYFFTFLTFTLIYMAVPNCKVKLHYAAIGAIVATVLFDLAKYGFAFYIVNFPTYQLLYGALAAIPIFLVWLYLSWLVILFGVLVSYELQNIKRK